MDRENEYVELNSIEEEPPVEKLPCEVPSVSSSGVLVFGGNPGPSERVRSVSTSVNRVEFPNLASTLQSIPSCSSSLNTNMVWDDASYSDYKLNCHKKKRKVLSLMYAV